jgi:hypothetical protein
MERRLLSRRLLKAREADARNTMDATEARNTVAATEVADEERNPSNFLFKQGSSILGRHPVHSHT